MFTRPIRFVALLLTGFLFGIAMLQAQTAALPSFVTDSLETYVSREMERWQVPGLAVAIVKDGEVIVQRGFGVASLQTGSPVDEETLFMIGSNTKLFTATVLTMLSHEGKMDLGDKVQKWMPEFRLKDPLAGREANIADLLCHRIGFETFQGDFTYWTSTLTRKEIIARMALVEAPHDIRTKWGYCNAAFLAAGELIPRITGKSWEEAVRGRILEPLAMERTLMLSENLEGAGNAASPHTLIDGKIGITPVPPIDNLAPAGSMSSCLKDMTRWLITQLGNGKVGGEQLIPASAILQTRQPYSIENLDSRNRQLTHFHLYGLGLVISDRDNRLVYSHTGGVNGFFSSVAFIPELDVGIAVLTNSDRNNLFKDLNDQLRDAFLDLPYTNISKASHDAYSRYRQRLEAKIDSLRQVVRRGYSPMLPLRSFTGLYHNQLYGSIELKIEDEQLRIHFSNHPDLIGKLEHLKNNSFLCTYSQPVFGIREIPFRVEDDRVLGMVLTVDDFIEFTPYEFIKAE